MNVLKKIWKNRWILKSIIQSIYFNFHYLPYKQAFRLPILLYRPKFLKLQGSIAICGGGENWYDYNGKVYLCSSSQ